MAGGDERVAKQHRRSLVRVHDGPEKGRAPGGAEGAGGRGDGTRARTRMQIEAGRTWARTASPPLPPPPCRGRGRAQKVYWV